MTPLVILGLIVLAIYVVIRLMTNLSAWITGARYRAYRQLAARYRGRYETRGLSDPPTVSFVHNGATVRVGLAPTIQGQPGQIPANPSRGAVRPRNSVSHGTGAGGPAGSSAVTSSNPPGHDR